MRQPKLNELQRREINRLYSTGGWTMEQLATRFSVHRRTIFRVLEEHGRSPEVTMVGPQERQVLRITEQFSRQGCTYTAAVSLIQDLRKVYGKRGTLINAAA